MYARVGREGARSMGSSAKLDHLLEDVVTLPSLPSTVAHITQLLNDPDTTVQEVGKAIAADTALALKTLRLVNSAYYGVREKISTVEHAAVLLGMKVIKNLVFTAAVFDSLQFGEEDLLRHNVSCGIAMKHLLASGLVQAEGIENADEGFVFGLLHDVGKIIMQHYMEEDARAVKEACVGRDLTAVEAELEVTGVDHAEIGARLAQQWKLQSQLVDAIAGHHDLSRCADPANRKIAAILAVADYVAYQAGMPAHEYMRVKISEEMWQETGLTPETSAPIVEKMIESIAEVDELVHLAD